MAQQRVTKNGSDMRNNVQTSSMQARRRSSSLASQISACSASSIQTAGPAPAPPAAFRRWPIGSALSEPPLIPPKFLFGQQQREYALSHLKRLGYEGCYPTNKEWVWVSIDLKAGQLVYIRPVSELEVYILETLNRRGIRQTSLNHTVALENVVRWDRIVNGKTEESQMGIFADAGTPAARYGFKTATVYYQVLLQVFEAIAFTHKQGIVYRDFHGWNTIIADTPRGPRVTLIDWENARLVEMPLKKDTKATLFAQEPFLQDVRIVGKLCLGDDSILSVMFGLPREAIKAYTTTKMAALFELMAAATQKKGGIAMVNALDLFRDAVAEASAGHSRLYFVQ